MDLAALVADSLLLLRSTLPATIAVNSRINPVPLLFADEAQFNQVFSIS